MAKALTGPETGKKGKQNKGLVSMADIEKLYQSEAQEAVAAAPQGEAVKRVVGKDMIFWLGEQELGETIKVIVVADAHLNVWYPDAYDPENPAPPGCFAVGPSLQKDAAGQVVPGTGEAGLKAHPTSPKIQGGPNGHDCATCELNKFGTAETGRGKACGNTRQLAIVMADDPAFRDKSELTWAQLAISPTGLAPWGKFVASLAKIEGRPPHGAVIEFGFNKRAKEERARKAVVAMGYQLIQDVGIAQKVNALRKSILESGALIRPLPVDVREPAKANGKGGGKKAKKKATETRKAKF